MITEKLRALAGVNKTLRLTWSNGYSAVGSILCTDRGYSILRDGDDRPRAIRPEQIERIEIVTEAVRPSRSHAESRPTRSASAC